MTPAAGPRLAFLVLALLTPSTVAHAAPEVPRAIRVVMDDNYPPFVFHTGERQLHGILIDQWQAWEKKTGIKVEIHAMDWGDALRRMRAGEFDVIDTIFETAERRDYFDFTPAYASIEVPNSPPGHLRHHGPQVAERISGRGQGGDHAADLLKASGLTTVLLFHNYEAIVEAARQHKINVFVVDAPPAIYFLNKLGIEAEFQRSPPINLRYPPGGAKRRCGPLAHGGRGLRGHRTSRVEADRREVAWPRAPWRALPHLCGIRRGDGALAHRGPRRVESLAQEH